MNLNWYYLLISPVILFALFFIYRVIRDNYLMFKNQKDVNYQLKRSILHAFLLWFPMLIPIILCIYFDVKIENNLEDAVYQDSFIIQADTTKRNFENDLDTSLVLIFDELKAEIDSRSNEIKKATEESKEELPKKMGDIVRNSYTAASPHIMDVPHQKSWGWKKRMKKKSARLYNKLSVNLTNQTNNSIKASNEKMAQSIEDEVSILMKSIDTSSDSLLLDVNNILEQNLDRSRIAVYNSSIRTYHIAKFAKTVIDILFLLAIIKSFLYVVARVLFRSDVGLTFSLLNKSTRNRGELKIFNKKYRIPGQSKETFYVKRELALNGPHPRLVYPQFFKCFFTRFFNKSLGLDKVDMKDFSEMATFSQTGGKEFIEYNLKKGEKCIFSFSNFIGMSNTVSLMTEYNFQLPSFLFERVIYSVAEGPGKLILKSNGNSTISPNTDVNKSVSLGRIIAFQKNTEFAVASNLEIKDVFFSDFHLAKQNTGNIIIDSEIISKKKKGIIRFFIRFLIPI